jgi:SPP1 gp7 family putative phage head morphogenesis protein
MKRTRAYWQKRAAQRFVRSEKLTLKYRRRIARLYSLSQKQLAEELKRIYSAYYGSQGWDKKLLNSIAPSENVTKFRKEMKRLGLEIELPDNYKGRTTRLDLLNQQIEIESQKLAIDEAKLGKSALQDVYNENYYKAGYDISKGIGGRPTSFGQLDKATLNQVFNTKWHAGNYASSLYANSRSRAHKIQNVIATGIATGMGIDKMSQLLRTELDASKRTADRLIRTEMNYFHGQSELQAYKEIGIDEYQLVAVLDNRTSAICQYMDGKVFKVSKAVVGENYHPFHPNCRTTSSPYLGREFEPKERIARNPVTGKNEFISNMTYDEWREKLNLQYANSDYDINKMLVKGYRTEYDEYRRAIGDKQMISYETFVNIRKNGKDATEKQKAWWRDAKAFKRLSSTNTKPHSLDFYTFRRNTSEPAYNEKWRAVGFSMDSRYHREYKGRLLLLDSHWLEHGEEVAQLSPSAYELNAKRLLNRRNSDGVEWIIEKKRGNIMVYDTKTNEFAVARDNGIISTYYKANPSYWKECKEKNYG